MSKKVSNELKNEDIMEAGGHKKRRKKDKDNSKNKKLRRRIIAGGVAVILLCLIIFPRVFAKEVYPSAFTTNAHVGNVEEKLETSGLVLSNQQKTYFSPVNASVSQLNGELGDSVKKGTKLVEFDLSDLENQNLQAKLQSDANNYGYQDSLKQSGKSAKEQSSAKTKVTSLENQIAQKEREIEGLQNSINYENTVAEESAYMTLAEIEEAKIQTNELLNTNRSEQIKYTAKIENAETELDALIEQNASTSAIQEKRSEIKGYEENMSELRTEESLYVQTLNMLAIEGVSTGSAATVNYQMQLETAMSDLAELKSDLAEQKALSSSSEAAILSDEQKSQMVTNNNILELSAATAEELVELGKKGIDAEFDGVITSVLAAEGTSAAQGMELITVSSNEDVSVEISITKYELEKLKVGQKADISIAGNTYEGTVEKINKMAVQNEQGVPIITAKVHIDNPDENIFLGVEAKISIVLRSAQNVTLVPVEAINEGKEGSFCYVVEDGIVQIKYIEIGVTSTEYAEIIGGIEIGADIVTNVTTDIVEGARVTPVDNGTANNSSAATSDQAEINEETEAD